MFKKIALLASLIAFCSLHGCSPRVVTQVRTEYRAVTDFQHDTLWRDRVELVREKGDTVTIIEKEYIYRTLWKSRADTCYVHDTTSVERIKEVKVEKPLSLLQRMKLRLFWLLVAALVWAFREPLLKLIKLIIGLL